MSDIGTLALNFSDLDEIFGAERSYIARCCEATTLGLSHKNPGAYSDTITVTITC